MIKKYSEFVKELNISWFGKKSKNFDANNLSEDEVEDQFLRLKEVLNCEIDITAVENTEPLRLKFFKKSYEIKVYLKVPLNRKENFEFYIDKVSDELDQIKSRIENMFNVEMTFIENLYGIEAERQNGQGVRTLGVAVATNYNNKWNAKFKKDLTEEDVSNGEFYYLECDIEIKIK